ncbi:MAG: trypsin-like peptidase domain-containing protein [Elusimicrobia bacterium]|nr:trypsin-like peptidase domain-containing protein [Elusimicrobiota bacterium]
MKLSLTALSLLVAVAPAFAQSSDDQFASSINLVRDAVMRQPSQFKGRPRFELMTQETGPNDPILLAQKPLLDLIKKVEGSVVFLAMTVPNEENPAKPGHATCTGFFTDAMKELGRASIITTNAHCVEKLAIGAEVEVGLYTGNDNRPKMTKGKVLAYGNSRGAKDIAFVELNDASLNRRALPIWTKLDRGETVVAIGNPLGLTYSVSKGIVSAIGRDNLSGQFVLDANQSDVAVNPGNSGGPLFNMWGSVVGINTMIASQSGGFEGISLSVPAGYITLAMQQYKRTGDLKMGALQLEVSASSTTKTLTAGKATPGGPAAAAQIQPGDQLLKVDGVDLGVMEPEDAMKAFLTYVKYHSPGEKLSLSVKRAGADVVVPVTLGEAKPAEPQRPEWAPIPPKEKKDKNGPASFVTI